ncbi:MAG TPA: glutamine--fructose-6-phosphate transaminase (isomerizing) [Bacteroidales bacterium]|nr:glutamine--fructose-6-phosphate transaminase (isomerizing) [Bacteroidales bacterium]HPJ91998.1 glutamine--fructose-6-phosphate transaminase (isomerizing) [Bacteroidales bacterium]
MCGIVAYIGDKEAYPILIKGLHRLEYRGYDSAGLALLQDKVNVIKTKGKVSDLEEYCESKDIAGTVGIAHTRWATHGEPNDLNAHPHLSNNKQMALIHNGIIENYQILKAELLRRGYEFKSNTDTEVLIHLIEDVQSKHDDMELYEAIRLALTQVVGTYGIAVISIDEPDTLIVAKKGSPLLIGIGEDEYYAASDGSAIVEYTKKVVYLKDGEMAILKKHKDIVLKTIENKNIIPYVQELEITLSQLEKGGYEHYMLKEIYEQPNSIADSMRGRLNVKKEIVSLGGIVEYEETILQARRIIIIGCGTSYHAGLLAEYMFEELVRIPVEVEYASEFIYRNPIIYEDDVVIAISQSGETADTLAAVNMVKEKGATVLGICNVVGSSIARATHAGSFTHAGPEIGVASTKAFTAQFTVLTLMALSLAKRKGKISRTKYFEMIAELERIPKKVKYTLQTDALTKEVAHYIKDSRNALYLGRKYNFPIALEGALKLKEISYIHAEGYPAAEMKHGPIALIDEEMPVIVIATNKGTYQKIISNIEEVKSRKGKIISIVFKGDQEVRNISDYVIEVPETDEMFSPFVSIIPLQLLAYHVAVLRGCNVDQPRNLAKSVTVE